MSTDDDFKSMNEDETPFESRKNRQKAGVIKSNRNQVKGTLHLDPQEEDLDHGIEFFQPITEGDQIVGVIHKCSCGKTSELRFTYSDT